MSAVTYGLGVGRLFHDLKELPDDSVADADWFSTVPAVNGHGGLEIADDELGFKNLLQGWVDRFIAEGGVSPDLVREQINVAGNVAHERSHGQAALMAGFSAVKYVVQSHSVESRQKLGLFKVQIIRNWSISPFILPLFPERDITKLALGSVVAAPVDLSLTDNAQLATMGYGNVIDLADRIAGFNDKHENTPLMLPLSVVT